VAQQSPTIEFEDVPLDESRRMNPDLSHALTAKIPSLGTTATRLTLPDGTTPTTMKNRILRVAAALKILVTVRRIPGGLLFWRSTNEDLQQATAVGQRLPVARKPVGTPRRSARRRG
jgi:hypothetical protein